MAEPDPPSLTPIVVGTHREFLKHMPEIVRRLNANPQIAKLVLINPIYALEDLAVTLAPAMADHVYQTFHAPPARQARLAELEREIRADLDKLPGQPPIPTTPAERARVVFGVLGVRRAAGDSDEQLDHVRLRSYAHRHPLIPKLIEHDFVSRSTFVFFPRAVYDDYKTGRVRQDWVNSVRFGNAAR
jgi:hypothetical protein